MMNGAEKNKSVRFQLIENTPNATELELLLMLYQQIFEDAKPEFFKQRLHEKETILSIIAFKNQQPVGFKIGYKYDEHTFYSWVGGVLKNVRNQGFASNLTTHQENWARKKGYTKLRTKSMNRFKPMMILNLKNGFDIKKIYTNDNGQTKIIFEKEIMKC